MVLGSGSLYYHRYDLHDSLAYIVLGKYVESGEIEIVKHD